MKRETTEFERAYTAKVNGLGLLLLVIHVPVLCAVAGFLGKSILPAAGFGALLLCGPALMLFFKRDAQAASIAIAIAAMGFSALSIHLTDGLIEAHFHILAMIALLILFGR